MKSQEQQESRVDHPCEPDPIRAAFYAWVEDQGCDSDGAWSAWQGCWELLASGGTPTSVDYLGLALDLEAQAKVAESKSAMRAMYSAARGLRLMGGEK